MTLVLNPSAKLSLAEIEKIRAADPFMRPDWRFERVLKMVDHQPSPGKTTKWDDHYIRDARSFLLKWRRGSDNERYALQFEYPGMYHAWNVFSNRIANDPEVALIVEAMLLTTYTFAEIAHAVKTSIETIEWYEAIWCNVHPYLPHYGWIIKHVLLPSADRFTPHVDEEDDAAGTVIKKFTTPPIIKPHLDMTLKYFSYFGGPIICDHMLCEFRRGVTCHTQDEIGDWYDEHWSTTAKRRSSQAMGVFQVDKWNVMELFATHARIIEVQRGVESQDERRTTIERHINAMLGEIPWVAGDMAAEVYKETPLAPYDEMAGELRADEMLFAMAGQVPENVKNLPNVNPFKARLAHKEAK